MIERYWWHKEAIDHGFAQYDPVTGAWDWKPELVYWVVGKGFQTNSLKKIP